MKLLSTSSLVILLVWSSLADDFDIKKDEHARGVREAKEDLKKKELKYLYYHSQTYTDDNHTSTIDDLHDKILKEKYQIQMMRVANSNVVNPLIQAHVEGYNSISEPEITKKFGKNLFEKTREELKKSLELKKLK
jgi:hypothetical protein